MDKIWVETLARLDVIEKSIIFIKSCLPILEPKPESQVDTVDLPKTESEPIDYESLDRQAQSNRIQGTLE